MDLDSYYEHIHQSGKLLTEQQARHWSKGILATLGTALDRKTKRSLAKALPAELADDLKAIFWLVHFRDPNLSRREFLQQAARRSGNSNAEFAIYPALAVFSGIRSFIAPDLQSQVANSLSPELRDFWEQAGALAPAVAEAR